MAGWFHEIEGKITIMRNASGTNNITFIHNKMGD
jgi:hypothetical protein